MKLFCSIAVTLVLVVSPPAVPAADATDQKAVLVTGATTGIGRAIAERLAAEGVFVYAGARKDADMAALNRIDNVMAVRLDVTKQDQIDAAVETIRDSDTRILSNSASPATPAAATKSSIITRIVSLLGNPL